MLTTTEPTWRNQSGVRPAKTPPPMGYRRSVEPEPSPYSNNSRTSRDGLLSSPASDDSPSQRPPPPQKSQTMPLNSNVGAGTSLTVPEDWRHPLRRMDSAESFLRSGAGEDADAKM